MILYPFLLQSGPTVLKTGAAQTIWVAKRNAQKMPKSPISGLVLKTHGNPKAWLLWVGESGRRGGGP